MLNHNNCHIAHLDWFILTTAPTVVLDGKEVTATAKQFLKNWQANKEALKRKKLLAMSGSETLSFGQCLPSAFHLLSM